MYSFCHVGGFSAFLQLSNKIKEIPQNPSSLTPPGGFSSQISTLEKLLIREAVITTATKLETVCKF
jgi:hypothetical protein